MEKLSWPYVAGLVDGEGCICIFLSRQKRRSKRFPVEVSLSLANTYHPIVQQLHKQFGGSLGKPPRRINPVTGNWAKRQQVWVIKSKKLQIVLIKLLPFLRIKKKQAILALKLLESKQKHKERPGRFPSKQGNPVSEKEYQYRLNLLQKCQILNKKGS